MASAWGERKWERIARRLFVLGDYGYATEFFGKNTDDPDFLSDEWLARWYGEPLKDYVLAALHEADESVL